MLPVAASCCTQYRRRPLCGRLWLFASPLTERSAVMSQEKYIGMDVHQATISVAVTDSRGKLIMESILETKSVEGFCCLFESDSTRWSAGDDGATGTCDRRGNNGSSSATNSVCDTTGIGGLCWAR